MNKKDKTFTKKDIFYFILVFLIILVITYFIHDSDKLENTMFYTYSTIVQTFGALVGIVILL